MRRRRCGDGHHHRLLQRQRRFPRRGDRAGREAMIRSLHEKTAKLPAAIRVPAGPVRARHRTGDAQGVYHGVRGMVKELVENYATELGNWPDIIATGGDAPEALRGLGTDPRDRARPDALRHRAGVHESLHQTPGLTSVARAPRRCTKSRACHLSDKRIMTNQNLAPSC